MGELIKKELKSFFSSLSGYVILTFFLVTTGVFLWVVPGIYNIPDSGMADMQPFFDLSPVLFLFLVPLLCMRLFAEEKRGGTIELLFTRPVAIWRIVAAKYLAGFLLVCFAIIPTVICPVSLCLLALPEGHIDGGGIIGSYIGLFFLAGIYVAAGVWASAKTDNQIVAFLYAMVISFLLYAGLEYLGEIPFLSGWQNAIAAWGIQGHYEPMSRGVIALSDVTYFVSFILLLLWATVRQFGGTRMKSLYIIPVFILLNLLAPSVHWRADITNDKRYTLSDNTRHLLHTIDKRVNVDIFLAGNLPPGIQKLQFATTRMLEEFRRITGNNFRYNLIDPTAIEDAEEKKAIVHYLAQRGIMPVNLNRRSSDETLSQQIIFPGMVIDDDETEVSISLLQNIPGQSAEENIHHSIEALEYELTNAIRLLMRDDKKNIAFLVGQGELPYMEVEDIIATLLHYYQVDFVDTDSLAADLMRYDALVVAKPTRDFSEKDKFIIDQYVMNGGRILWCVDEVDVEHELLKKQETVGAVYRPLNIEDLLFRYGVRINPELVMDGSAVLIPVMTGINGNIPEYTPAPWYFSPLLFSGEQHPITAGLHPVRVDYANSIDTIGGNSGLKKTVLLSTSRYTALVKTPAPVSLSIAGEKLTPERFKHRFKPIAVAVEGHFTSLFQYRNREQINTPFRAESDHNRMIVIADGDIIRNKVRGVGENAVVVPLGYDEYSGQMYGNKDFLLNCINWLCDDEGWMQLRGRNLSLYLLDKTRLKAERGYWAAANLLLPLLLVALGGGTFRLIRKRRFARK